MLARRTVFSGLVLLLYITGAIAEDKPCTIHEDGRFYDLNPLKSKKDYEVKTSSGQKISLNVCQSVRTELFGLKDDIQAGDVGAFVRRARGDFAFGKVNTTLTIFDGRPRYVLSGGSRCKPKAGGEPVDVRASALVEFVCDMSTFGPGTPRLLAQLPPGDDEAGCAYVIEWKTHFACPTSEGGGVWGFFAILAVVFLVLLMSYTVLGTLYNRYVLQLRGFDQIPQFSVESMKYHGREAYDWIKDMIAALNMGGHASGGSGGGYSGLPSAGIPTTNPVSHQSQQMFGAGDVQEGGGPFGGGGGGFIRPQASRTQSNTFRRLETNPISHQSQVNAQSTQSLSFSASVPHSPSPPTQSPYPESTIPQARRPGPPDSRESTKDEREFMLGDEDDDAEELGDISAPPPLPQNVPSSPPSRTPNVNAAASSIPEENPAAAARGRDLGGGDVIRL